MDITTGLDHALAEMLEDELSSPIRSAHTVRELIALLDRRDHDLTDDILHTLISRSATDSQARSILLHTMRPVLERITWKYLKKNGTTGNYPDFASAFCFVVEAFYSALEMPGVRAKTKHVASRLRWETNDQMDSQRRAEAPTCETLLDDEQTLAVLREIELLPEASTHDSQIDLLECLAWARDHNVITLDEARFLIAIYSPDSGIDVADLDLGDLSQTAIRKRASRLAKRISAAVLDEQDILIGSLGRAAA